MCCAQARWLAGLNSVLCLILALHTPTSNSGEAAQRDVLNLTAIYSARQETSLQDLAGFWTYNETFDISKYEDFDHSKFLVQFSRMCEVLGIRKTALNPQSDESIKDE
ncbi:hypothetical protein J6590_032118 [Homalodisca vitripennis]|nr:hypothetical protein J6590_032118 [Homalodisca vitripennis]